MSFNILFTKCLKIFKHVIPLTYSRAYKYFNNRRVHDESTLERNLKINIEVCDLSS